MNIGESYEIEGVMFIVRDLQTIDTEDGGNIQIVVGVPLSE